MTGWRLRPLHEGDDLDRFGRIVLEAYQVLPGYVGEGEYERELLDVASRLRSAEVVGAFDEGGRPVGCLTYVPGTESPLAEHANPGAASIRMLGVDPTAQGRGIGEALVRWGIDRAVADGCREVLLHTTPWMPGARHLYERLGFERAPDLDSEPLPDLLLLGYRLPLAPDVAEDG